MDPPGCVIRERVNYSRRVSIYSGVVTHIEQIVAATGNAVGPLAYADCVPDDDDDDDVPLLCEIYAEMTDTTERTT